MQSQACGFSAAEHDCNSFWFWWLAISSALLPHHSISPQPSLVVAMTWVIAMLNDAIVAMGAWNGLKVEFTTDQAYQPPPRELRPPLRRSQAPPAGCRSVY